MNIYILGTSFKTADVELRQQMQKFDLNQVMGILHPKYVQELITVSTCNRMELYFVLPSGIENSEQIIESIIETLTSRAGLPSNYFESNGYFLQNADAVEHIFKVACGLESLVIGENEIYGQVRAGFKTAKELGTLGKTFRLLQDELYKCVKKVRSFTALGNGTTSLARVAATHFQQHVEALEPRTLVVGAGQMSSSYINYALKYSDSEKCNIFIINRSIDNAKKLAEEKNVDYINFSISQTDKFYKEIEAADIIFIATSSKEPVITHKEFSKLSKKTRLIVDLSVPRNVDVAVRQVEGTVLVHVDDIQHIVEDNTVQRQDDIAKSLPIIDNAVANFYAKKRLKDHAYIFRMIQSASKRNYERLISEAIENNVVVEDKIEQFRKIMHNYVVKNAHAHYSALQRMIVSGVDISEIFDEKAFAMHGGMSMHGVTSGSIHGGSHLQGGDNGRASSHHQHHYNKHHNGKK